MKKIEPLPVATDEFLARNTEAMPCGDFQIEVIKNLNYLSKRINEIIDYLSTLNPRRK